MFSFSLVGGNFSVRVALGVGTFFLISDVIYSIYLYLALTSNPKSKKKKLSFGNSVGNIKKNPVKQIQEQAIIPNRSKCWVPFRNLWYRDLPRTDFRSQSPDSLWNTALFFPEVFPHEDFSQTRQFMWYLEQARVSLKIAIYTSSFKLLEEVLFDLVRKKVRVQAVSDVPKVLRWRKRGVNVREKPKLVRSQHPGNLFLDHMHNKFIIIDDKAIMTGSLNWTESAITENRENVLVTNNVDTVALYVEEFEQLWEISDPKKPKIIQDGPPLTEKQKKDNRTNTPYRKSF